jgi:hypothetical protein
VDFDAIRAHGLTVKQNDYGRLSGGIRTSRLVGTAEHDPVPPAGIRFYNARDAFCASLLQGPTMCRR